MLKLAIALLLAVLLIPASAFADPGWLTPETVGQGLGGELVAAEAGGGTIVYAWTASAGGQSNVYAGVRPPGGPWVPGVRVSSSTTPAGPASVAVAPNGTAAVAYSQADATGKFVVRVAVRAPAGTWAPPETVSPTAAGTDQLPQVAIADSGEIVVAWVGPVLTITAVQVARRSLSGTWSQTPADVSQKSASGLRLVMDGAGNATALWLQPSGGAGTPAAVAAATRAAGGTWTLPQVLSPAPEDDDDRASNLSLAVGATGVVAATWRRPTFGNGGIDEGATRPLGGAWTVNSLGRVSAGAEPMTVAVDGAGMATTVWSNDKDAVSRRSPPAGPWSAETNLSTPLFYESSRVRAAGSASGYTFVVWTARSLAGPRHMQGAIFSPSGGWSVGQDLGQVQSGLTLLALNDEQGNGTVLWNDGAGTLRARTYDTGPPVIGTPGIPATAIVNEAAAFSASPVDRWSATTTTWDFGDGTSAAGAAVTHAYAATGTYAVRVTATDVLGNAASATGTVTVGDPPPPPPPPPPPELPKPALVAGTGSLSATFQRSAIKGRPTLKLAGSLNQQRSLTFVLNGPLRPAGARGDVSLGTVALPAGAFDRELVVPAGAAARLLPGAWTVRATGADVSASWPVVLPAPKEGVVLSKKLSTSRNGRGLLAVTRAKSLWATFTFADGSLPKGKLTARWYRPKRAKPAASFPVRGPKAISFIRDRGGLARGTWKCELRAGNTVVETVSIRIG